MPKLPLLGQTYSARSTFVHGDTCINYYPEIMDKDIVLKPELAAGTNTTSVVLYPTPGVVSRCDTSQPNVRGMVTFNGFIYCVAGINFYKLTQSIDGVTLTATLIGTLPTYPSSGPVSIISNGNLGNQLLITDGFNKYVYDLITTSFVAVTDPSGVLTDQATYQDGYGIFINKNTNQFFLTNLLDFGIVDALNYASSTTKPDNLVAAFAIQQYVFLFGETGTEVWYNSGTTTINGETTTFPFSRVPQNYLEQGCAAPFSIVKADNTIFWLTRNERGNGYIVKLSGTTPKIVSTTPINNMIDSFTVLSDCIAYAYQDLGHEFVVFTFPTEDKTLVFDAATSLWHTRSSLRVGSPGTGNIQGRHISNCYAFLNGIHYVGDWHSGKIYQMSSGIYDDAGSTITRERTSQHISFDNKLISMYKVELDMTRGKGLVTGQGSDPSVLLYVSKDGGQTFTSKGSRSFGQIGAYSTRIKWNSLGASRDWVFKIIETDPVEHVLISAIADYEVSTV